MSRRFLESFRQARRSVWSLQPAQQSRGKAWLIRAARFVAVLARDLRSGQLTLRAMSLVYTTLLSIVPLLALSFSVLKAFGVHNQIEPMLDNFLAPLGAQGVEITRRILQFIENMNVGVLGAAGLGFLLYTAVSLMQKIEESFNFIWHIGHARSLSERFSRYVSALLIGPLLVFSALGITATVMGSEVMQRIVAFQLLSPLVAALTRLMPYLFIIAAFAFLYAFIPNTRVRLWPALAAGSVAGILWQTAGWAFALFVATSTKYSAIYSGFAVLMLFMIWLYLCWLILLFGASIAFYVQHPEYLMTSGDQPSLSSRMRERLALALMSLIAEHYASGRPPWTLERLGSALAVPTYALEPLLRALRQAGILAQSDAAVPGYLPQRDLAKVSVKEVLDVARSAGEGAHFTPEMLSLPPRVADIAQQFERNLADAFGAISIASLGQQRPAPDEPQRPQPAEKAAARD